MSLPSGLLAVASSAVGLKSNGESGERSEGWREETDRKGKEGEIAAGQGHVYSHVSVCLARVFERGGRRFPAALLRPCAHYTDTI